MQVVLTEEENDRLNKAYQQITSIESKVDRLLHLLDPKMDEIVWPYGNWENCKYTFPDASELPALQILNPSYESPHISFKQDGTIRFNLPSGMPFIPTKNAKYPRIERLERKDLANHINYKIGDEVSREFIVVFHQLNLGESDAVFSQIHGEDMNGTGDEPYFKCVAGKKGIRVQCKTKEDLTSDDHVFELLAHEDLKLETAYHYKYTFDGTLLDIELGGIRKIIAFDRTDEFYLKDGLYGPLGASLSHKPV